MSSAVKITIFQSYEDKSVHRAFSQMMKLYLMTWRFFTKSYFFHMCCIFLYQDLHLKQLCVRLIFWRENLFINSIKDIYAHLAKLQSPLLSVLSFCLCDKVYHKQESMLSFVFTRADCQQTIITVIIGLELTMYGYNRWFWLTVGELSIACTLNTGNRCLSKVNISLQGSSLKIFFRFFFFSSFWSCKNLK